VIRKGGNIKLCHRDKTEKNWSLSPAEWAWVIKLVASEILSWERRIEPIPNGLKAKGETIRMTESFPLNREI
jgi:hypothetical protein